MRPTVSQGTQAGKLIESQTQLVIVLLFIGRGKGADREGYTPAHAVRNWSETDDPVTNRKAFLSYDAICRLKDDLKLIFQPVQEKLALTELGEIAFKYLDQHPDYREAKSAPVSAAPPAKVTQDAEEDDAEEDDADDSERSAPGAGVETDSEREESAETGGARPKRRRDRHGA